MPPSRPSPACSSPTDQTSTSTQVRAKTTISGRATSRIRCYCEPRGVSSVVNRMKAKTAPSRTATAAISSNAARRKGGA